MKSKAPLVMMEQMVMILVFALAAALCMQAFVLSDSLSARDESRDTAVLLCENIAEEYKGFQKMAGPAATEGGTQTDIQKYYFDEKGARTETAPAYRIEVQPVSVEEPLDEKLGKAMVQAFDEESGKLLYGFEFAWQREVR